MTVRNTAEQAAWIVAVGLLLLLSPKLPAPWGYTAAIAATILGPGHGIPDSLFPDGRLTTPERWLVTVLASVGVVVLATFVLLKMGVRLDRTVVVLAVLGLTVLSSIASVVTRWARPPAGGLTARLSVRRQRLMFFGGGAAIGALIVGLVLRVAGI